MFFEETACWFVMFWAVLFIGGNYRGSISISVCQVIFGMALYGDILIVLKIMLFMMLGNHKKKEIILEEYFYSIFYVRKRRNKY